jgi:hypothetical protein
MNATTEQEIGLVQVGKTTYSVVRYAVQSAAEADGVRNMFGLFGPRGAVFLVVDRGPEWRLNVVRTTGRTVSGAQMPLTRAHLAAFGVEA